MSGMLSYFIATKQQTDLIIAPGADGIVRLEGMQEAHDRLSSVFSCPELTAPNAIAAATAASSTTVELYKAWSGEENTLDTTAMIYAGFNIFFSQATQMYKLINAYLNNRKTLDMFIDAIPLDQVALCYFIDPKTKNVINAIDPATSEKLTSARIRTFMSQHGEVTIQLRDRNKIFTLNDLGFLSLRVSGSLAVGTTLSLASGAIFLGSRITDANAGQTDLTLYTAASIASSIPFTSLFSTFVNSCSTQHSNLSNAIITILNMYEDAKQLPNMPEEFLAVLDRYIDADTMLTNRKTIAALRKQQPLALAPNRHGVIEPITELSENLRTKAKLTAKPGTETVLTVRVKDDQDLEKGQQPTRHKLTNGH